MPLWNGVRPGTIQNTVLDWFYANFEGTTAELALFIYRDDSAYYRNRVASALRALELKRKITNPSRGTWRINTAPIEGVSPEAQEARIRDLEATVLTILKDIHTNRTRIAQIDQLLLEG